MILLPQYQTVPEGKRTVLRVADIGDSVRSYTFHVAGHLMLRPAPLSLDESDIPYDAPFKPFIERGTTDLSLLRLFSLQLVGGAGGLQDKHGDYLYQDQKLARSVEGGAWGILTVQPADFDPVKAANYLVDASLILRISHVILNRIDRRNSKNIRQVTFL